MTTTLFVGILLAVFFYRAAEYERMAPLLWAIASLGLTMVAGAVWGGLWSILIAQVLLFALMTLYNAQRRR